MSIKLHQNASIIDENSLKVHQHILFALSENADKSVPFMQTLQSKLLRSKTKFDDLKKRPSL